MRAGFLLALWAVAAVAADNRDERPYINQDVGLVCPFRVGAFTRGDLTVYEDRSLGVLVHYTCPGGTKADLYLYPAPGLATPAPGQPLPRELMFHFAVVKDGVAEMGRRGQYRDLKLVDEGKCRLLPDRGGPVGVKALFQFELGPTPCHSQVLLFAMHEHFVKFRITYPSASRGDREREITALLEGFEWPLLDDEPAAKRMQALMEQFLTDPVGQAESGVIIRNYVGDSKRVTVNVTLPVLNWMEAGKNYRYSDLLLTAFIAGNARAQLTAGQPGNDNRAGLLAALQVYQRLQQREQGYVVPELDEYRQLEQNGQLDQRLKLLEHLATTPEGTDI